MKKIIKNVDDLKVGMTVEFQDGGTSKQGNLGQLEKVSGGYDWGVEIGNTLYTIAFDGVLSGHFFPIYEIIKNPSGSTSVYKLMDWATKIQVALCKEGIWEDVEDLIAICPGEAPERLLGMKYFNNEDE